MPLPVTVVVVPTVVPPEVHVLGALACGPNTVKVIAPLIAGLVVPPDTTELMFAAVIAVPAVPLTGPVAVTAGVTLAMVRVNVWVEFGATPLMALMHRV